MARQKKSRNPTLQAPRQLESRIWVPGCLNLIILSSSIRDLLGCNRAPQAATGCQPSGPASTIGRHRPPQAANLLAQHPANLPKSVLPPAQECQIAHLGTLATPVEPKWHQGLAANTRSDQRPSKCSSNSVRIWHQANKKTSIRASKHPSLGS